MSEHESLEENVGRLNEANDENSCFGIVCQCHLTLMRNEKQVDLKKKVCEHNELMINYEKMEKETQCLVTKHDGLIEMYRKLMHDCDDVTNVHAND